ncbi:sensor histidine kinase [Dinghuibacter silviterrae]|uniref:histidine kinase n=1 Tax=Dinghuibacter silviterrae TaxID=1539049 RepID=A0A4R8DVW7_9BACT|nr:ATP-binding protein [Dinghuibacter silviterrae]TDX02078.1 signal transduction histidine kinase [Dinghuibacter silviterrae]
MPKWALSLIILLCLQEARGQDLDYNVVQYNSENGLPENSVNDLLLDRNRYLWIATQYGLARFDGQHFRVYNTSNTPVLKSNRVTVLFETKDHRILIPSTFGDSVLYEVTRDYVIRKDTTGARLKRTVVNDHSTGVFDFAGMPVSLARGHPKWIINEHEAVVAQGHDYFYLNNQTGAITLLPAVANARACVIGDLFVLVRPDGAANGFQNGRPVPLTADSLAKAVFRGTEDWPDARFFINIKGGRSIVRRNNDIYDLRIAGGRLTAKRLFRNLSFLQNMAEYTLQYDSTEERLFIGTLNAGLWVVTRHQFHTYAFTTSDANNNIFEAFQWLPGRGFFTSRGILGPGESRPSTAPDLPNWSCFYKSPDGALWYTRGKHLYRYDLHTRRETEPDTMKLDDCVVSMTGSWIATRHSLLVMGQNGLRFVLKRAFEAHHIEIIADISPTVLWIGTTNGLYAFDKEAGTLENVLPKVDARCIYKARDGSLWVGTYGQGYYKYWKGLFRALPLDPEHYLEAAHAFLEDHEGYFWISTNHGLFRIRKAELDSAACGVGYRPLMYYFDKSCGFRTNEFNGGCQPAVVEDGAGHAFFPSMNGIVGFTPDSCRAEMAGGPLLVDGMTVDSVALDCRKNNKIGADFNRIVVQVSTPFYGAPENLHEEYRLVGDTWFPVSSDGSIVINKLPYGAYTLSIRKWNGYRFDKVHVVFRVLPHWYDEPLVWVVVLVVLFIVILYMRYRFWRLQNLRLQRKVAERTFDLERSTLIKNNLISVIMHDLRSPLHAQDLLIKTLYRQYQRAGGGDLTYILGELQTSSRNVVQFTSDFLVWYHSQQTGFSLMLERVTLQPFVAQILDFHQAAAVQKGIVLGQDIDPTLTLWTDPHLLAIVLRNIVDNAVKYTARGSVRVHASVSGTDVRIRVADTGKGMSPEVLTALVSGDTELVSGDAAPKISSSGGHFLGYRFIRDFIGQLGGDIAIESAYGKGTTVTVVLPLRPA